MPESQLKGLKKSIHETIPKVVVDAISKLKASDDWFQCKEELYQTYSLFGSPLWGIIESIDQPIVPILKGGGLSVTMRTTGSNVQSEIAPIWMLFRDSIKERLENLNKRYGEVMREYCILKEEIRSSEEEKKKRAASNMWKSVQ
jgi:hypothetical protein